MEAHVQSITVVVVNFNAGDLLHRCLRALADQDIHHFDVIVVDNGSTDSSLDNLTGVCCNLRIIRAGQNLGFAAANNLALQYSSSEWVALLNPDAFPSPDWLKRLLGAVERNPEFDFFASRAVLADRVDVLDGVGDVYHVSGLFWRRGHGVPAAGRFMVDEEVFSPCAAAGFYRRQALDEVGGFDEDFFCYAEDVDLGFRLRLAGYRCLYVPDAVVAHVGSAITGRRSGFSIYYGHRNLVWTFVKNMPPSLFWLCLPAHLALNLVSLVWFSARGDGAIIFRAKWDAIRGLPGMWVKRRKIQVSRRVGGSDIRRYMATGLPVER
jgi:GT2 family glycosyltransferase